MNIRRHHRSPRTTRRAAPRRGVLSVELVMTLPVLLMTIVGAVLLNQMLMSNQAVGAAAANGAREATMPGATATSVRETVLRSVQGWRFANNPIDVKVTIRVNGVPLASDPAALADAATGDDVSVTVRVAAVKAVPDMLKTFGLTIADQQLETTYHMRKE
ncbi:MAG: pilus assembly protein [Planctomycetia bacterium]|nr:pilus assembly protein [Planctomycetia bacterium]